LGEISRTCVSLVPAGRWFEKTSKIYVLLIDFVGQVCYSVISACFP